ncbi:NUDIX domain-containing protein [Halioglobus maricola]|uniref:NUDIX domain-containing protein n=1 Tax=Halioglobus maricola TaxID=2601894 RepID=A0A5P9NH64_9GAMM|nr:NUDIX hydrolase [Halioglobus maricola]QFU74554.1 NUDIX domain-containing protein [Halioglobus maricola]
MSGTRYCPECGAALARHVVGGETRNHWICTGCSALHHDSPMIVVTAFVACEDRLLWVQRGIEPQRGQWAIPGGFMEQQETLAQGAARELHEEAGVLLPPEQLQLYMTGTITFINQVYVAFRARVDTDFCEPGPESQACGFFSRDECPWLDVAYPQVNDSIEQAYSDLESGRFDVWQAEMTEGRYDFWSVSQSGR